MDTERPLLPARNVLPNNLADFPRRQPWQDADAPSRGMLRHVAVRLLLLIVLGGLVGFGAYRLATDEGSPPPPSLATPPPDESAPSSTDVGNSTPDDGSAPELVVTGLLGNQDQSQNWSGYAATVGGYTAVSATWIMPASGLSSPPGMDAVWVGIGGVRSNDLIQAGTQRTILQNGATQLEAWVEVLPRASESVPLAIGPGDTVHVSIDQQGPETWLIVLNNVTSGQTYQVTKQYASSLSSAEWVEESPSAGRRRTLPLDNFGVIRFSQASTVRDGQVLNLAQSGAHRITMITPAGLALAEPSALGADGASFTVTRTSVPSPPPSVAPRRRP